MTSIPYLRTFRLLLVIGIMETILGIILSIFIIVENAVYIILAGYALFLISITYYGYYDVLFLNQAGDKPGCCISSFCSISLAFAILIIAPYPLGFGKSSGHLGEFGTLGIGFIIFVIGYAFAGIVANIMRKDTGSDVQRYPVRDYRYEVPPKPHEVSSSEDRKSKSDRVIEREKLLVRRIPPECHKCGADINPEEVDWIGPDTVRCSHCGASLVVEFERV